MQQVNYNRAIAWWLLSGALLILAMVVIGGITRLTGSGLSIVEWNVISGTLPPLSETAWAIAFEKYKQFPEFQKLNFNMTLSGFKNIFWWEYLHRLLGRIIGIVFIVPFLYFYVKKQFSRWLLRRLMFILLLGMAQGLMGWIMVKSGLNENPHVSHFRLAAHLCLALTLIGTILWTIADLVLPKQLHTSGKLATTATIMLGAIVLQIILGAFVAGLKAGFSYNTYPLMNGEFFPSHVTEGLSLVGLLENGPTVQFIHRWVAIVVLLVVLYFWYKHKQVATSRFIARLTNVLLVTILLQVVLGIVTLLLAVPVTIGVLHQVVAVLLFSVGVLLVHQLRQESAQSIA
ncbi:COX15/CtaA family protein [Pontibacter fetidus]|uniref:Heme A synthase n=1 Tax=Pontibacter fetidus TaxID=2700082 RepID=A0A6B2GYZ8_9BACT|nr:COX15/CtaA family protein [Pontibacter fetidus]NDK55273.1 heme A synthase [Pontibacter fetidus]